MAEATRREFLQATLGTGLGVAAGGCGFRVNEIAGEIKGAAHSSGHKVRDARQFESLLATGSSTTRVEAQNEHNVLVVGAGPSGLAAAWRLRALGENSLVLLDLEDQPGGTSRFGNDGVVSYPWGAHYVPAPRPENTALVRVLTEMGAIRGENPDQSLRFAEDMLVRDPEERIFYKGAWYDGLYLRAGATDEDLAQLARFQATISKYVSWRDSKGRRAFEIPMELGSDDDEITSLDSITMDKWMTDNGFTSERLIWLVDYACRDDYGMRIGQTSAWAGLFYFASRVGAAGEEAAELLAWSNGNGRLVEHLSKGALGHIRTKKMVLDLWQDEKAAEALVLDLDTNTIEKYRAKQIVFAAQKFLAPKLIRQVREQKESVFDQFTYSPWMVANLHLRDHPVSKGAPLAWDNVLYDSPSLGYVVATHQAHLDDGPTVLTYYYPFADAEPKKGRELLLAGDHAHFVNVVMTDLQRAHRNLAKIVDRIDVWRWGHAMARPTPGFVWGTARRKASESLGRIHMAHSDLSGLALFEEALFHGVTAAEKAFSQLYPESENTIERLGAKK